MLEIYWACLIGGVLFAIGTVLLGDLIGHGDHDLSGGHHGVDFLKPAVIVSAVAVFGGAGVLLTRYSGIGAGRAVSLAIAIAVIAAVLIYFLYVKPMMRSENSVGYSIREFVGRVGEVTTSIPSEGYGEVIVRVGASNTNQIAASLDAQSIQRGTQVVVVEVDRDTLYVTPLDNS